MEEKYLYRSALEHCWLSVTQIQERIQQKPYQKHELWQQGWIEWQSWRKVPCFYSLSEQIPIENYHYIHSDNNKLRQLVNVELFYPFF